MAHRVKLTTCDPAASAVLDHSAPVLVALEGGSDYCEAREIGRLASREIPVILEVTIADASRPTEGQFGFGHGSGAHAPDEYYLTESKNPKIQGIDGAVRSHVEFMFELASMT